MPQPRLTKPKAQPVATVAQTRRNGETGPQGLGLIGALAAHLVAQHQQRQAASTRTGTSATDPYSQMQQRTGIGAFTVGGMQ